MMARTLTGDATISPTLVAGRAFEASTVRLGAHDEMLMAHFRRRDGYEGQRWLHHRTGSDGDERSSRYYHAMLCCWAEAGAIMPTPPIFPCYCVSAPNFELPPDDDAPGDSRPRVRSVGG